MAHHHQNSQSPFQILNTENTLPVWVYHICFMFTCNFTSLNMLKDKTWRIKQTACLWLGALSGCITNSSLGIQLSKGSNKKSNLFFLVVPTVTLSRMLAINFPWEKWKINTFLYIFSSLPSPTLPLLLFSTLLYKITCRHHHRFVTLSHQFHPLSPHNTFGCTMNISVKKLHFYWVTWHSSVYMHATTSWKRADKGESSNSTNE